MTHTPIRTALPSITNPTLSLGALIVAAVIVGTGLLVLLLPATYVLAIGLGLLVCAVPVATHWILDRFER